MTAIPDLNTLLEQEKQCRFSHFNFDTAWEIGTTLQTKAKQANYPVAIEVYAFGQPLFLTALPGSSTENLEWIKRKRNSVLRAAHSSLYIGEANQTKQSPMETHAYINQAEYCDHGGSFPLFNQDGCIIGAVTVSGLAAIDDHNLVYQTLLEHVERS